MLRTDACRPSDQYPPSAEFDLKAPIPTDCAAHDDTDIKQGNNSTAFIDASHEQMLAITLAWVKCDIPTSKRMPSGRSYFPDEGVFNSRLSPETAFLDFVSLDSGNDTERAAAQPLSVWSVTFGPIED